MICLFGVFVGSFTLIIGICSLFKINQKHPSITYGNGLDKHLEQSGPFTSHEMVIKDGKSIPTSHNHSIKQ